MSERREVLAQIERLIELLSGPLPASELAAGWSERSRRNFLHYFQQLRRGVQEGQPTSAGRLPASIAREMDYWGIGGGGLLELAASLWPALRRLSDDHKR